MTAAVLLLLLTVRGRTAADAQPLLIKTDDRSHLTPADDSATIVQRAAASTVAFVQLPDGAFALTNGAVRSLWAPRNDGGRLDQHFEVARPAGVPGWLRLASATSYQVVRRNFQYGGEGIAFNRRQFLLPGWPKLQPDSAIGAVSAGGPPVGTTFRVTGNDTSHCEVRFAVPLTNLSSWSVAVTVSLSTGEKYASESVSFQREALDTGPASDIRVRKVFETTNDLPEQFNRSFWRTLDYFGWATAHGGSFVFQAVNPAKRWSAQRGGGAPYDVSWYGNSNTPVQSSHTVYHQAPTGAQEIGWITAEDVPVGASYILDHNLWMRTSYHYDRAALKELWAVSPPELLSPRYSGHYMVDKYMHLLRFMPGSWASFNTSTGKEFGFFNQGWVDFQNASIVASAYPKGFTELKEYSLDWGAGMSTWTATFLLLYKQKYGDVDGFIAEKYSLLRNAFAELPWNVENSTGTPSLNGALWQAWSPSVGVAELYPPPEDFSPPDKNKSIIWLCDSGKAGYMFLRMYELTGKRDTALLERATLAAEFLLRVQQPNGDFLASVFDARTSAVVRGPTFAATTSAILLWAKLFEVTGDKTWLTAAEACAAAVSRNYLSPGEFQIDGGELDNVMTKNHLHANSAGCYGVMGLSALAIVTQNETHIQLVRVVMDYMLAQQWTRDINLGYYLPKFRFQGANTGVAIGASTNGMFRSEITLFPWMAYKATGDPLYLASFKATMAYQSHAQYDNPYDTNFFGGGDEGVFQSYQVINGWGCSFLGETVGQGVGIMEYLLNSTATDVQPLVSKTDDAAAGVVADSQPLLELHDADAKALAQWHSVATNNTEVAHCAPDRAATNSQSLLIKTDDRSHFVVAVTNKLRPPPDVNSSSANGPHIVSSLHDAAAAVWARKGNQRIAETVIELCGGHHPVHGLVLGPEHSGSDIAPVTWRSAGRNVAVIGGGYLITGWREVTNKRFPGRLWEAAIPVGLRSRNLWVNGNRAVRARSAGPVISSAWAGDDMRLSAQITTSGYVNASCVENVPVCGNWGPSYPWSCPGTHIGAWSNVSSWIACKNQCCRTANCSTAMFFSGNETELRGNPNCYALARRVSVATCTIEPATVVATAMLSRTASPPPQRDCPSAPLHQWLRPGTEFVYHPIGASWTEPRCPVTSVVESLTSGGGAAIEMGNPCFSVARNKVQNQGVSYPAYVENAFALLSEPGEWFADFESRKLYYVPLPGEDLSTVQAVMGTAATSSSDGEHSHTPSWASATSAIILLPHSAHMVFHRLVFSHLTWLRPSTNLGYVDLQYGQWFYGDTPLQYYNKHHHWPLHTIPAALAIRGSHHINVTECSFLRLGSSGVSVDGGSQSIRITSCEFRDVSGSAVSMGNISQPNLPLVEQDRLLAVTNNSFESLAVEYHGASGAYFGYVSELTLAQNDIRNTSNSAIVIGGGFQQINSMRNNKIIANRISFACTHLIDCGSIYTLSAENNSEIAYNYIENQQKLYGSIYHDWRSSGFHVHHNVIVGGPMWLYLQWGCLGAVDNLRIEQNFHNQSVSGGCARAELAPSCSCTPPKGPVGGCATLPREVPCGNLSLRSNVLVAGSDWPSEAIAIEANAGTLKLDDDDSATIV